MPCYPTYHGYRGTKCWEVTHPRHKPVIVVAKDELCAILTAAKFWGEDWRSPDYHGFAAAKRREELDGGVDNGIHG